MPLALPPPPVVKSRKNEDVLPEPKRQKKSDCNTALNKKSRTAISVKSSNSHLNICGAVKDEEVSERSLVATPVDPRTITLGMESAQAYPQTTAEQSEFRPRPTPPMPDPVVPVVPEDPLKECRLLLAELMGPLHAEYARPFYSLPASGSSAVNGGPPDLQGVQRKLDTGRYLSAAEFADDVRFIFTDCYRHHSPGSEMVNLAQKLQVAVSSLWGGRGLRPNRSGRGLRLNMGGRGLRPNMGGTIFGPVTDR